MSDDDELPEDPDDADIEGDNDPLARAIELGLECRDFLDRAGSPHARLLIDLLLIELGRQLAHLPPDFLT